MSRQVPPWLVTALEEIGTTEVPGNANNPRVVEYHKATTLKASLDSVPWCAAFCNWCLMQNRIVGTDSARARSFLNWGTDVPLDKWKLGAIAVFSRGNNPAEGHVGFLLDVYGGMYDIISGNTSNRVRITKYGRQGLLGLRWPNVVPPL